jgi:hypothetical protein
MMPPDSDNAAAASRMESLRDMCFSFAVELTRGERSFIRPPAQTTAVRECFRLQRENMSVTHRGTFSIKSSVDCFGVQQLDDGKRRRVSQLCPSEMAATHRYGCITP